MQNSGRSAKKSPVKAKSATAKRFEQISSELTAFQDGTKTLSAPTPPQPKQPPEEIKVEIHPSAETETKTISAPSCSRIRNFTKLVTVLTAAGVDTLSVSTGIEESKRSLIGFIQPSIQNNVLLSTAYALAYIRTYGKQISDGTDKTIDLFSEGQLKAAWKETPKGKLGITLLSAAYSAFADFTATRKFFLELADVPDAASLVSGLYVLTVWLSETRIGWENFRHLSSDKEKKPFTLPDLFIYAMAFFSGCGAITLSYDTTHNATDFKNIYLEFFTLFCALTRGLSDASSSTQQYRELLAYPMHFIPRHIVFALCAVAVSAAFTDATAETYSHVAADVRLPFNTTLPDSAQTIIGYGTGVSHSGLAALGLFATLDWSYNLVKQAGARLFKSCRKPAEQKGYTRLSSDEKPTAIGENKVTLFGSINSTAPVVKQQQPSCIIS